MSDTPGTKRAVDWLDEIYHRLEDEYAQVLWILRHGIDAEDEILVRHLAPALAPLEDVITRLDGYFWRHGLRPGKSEVSTGTVDVPHPHDGGSGGGGLRREKPWGERDHRHPADG